MACGIDSAKNPAVSILWLCIYTKSVVLAV